MSFTEFACRPAIASSNLNSGTKSGSSTEPGANADYTGVGDSDGTSKFTPSDGSTPASSVSVGDFASIYVTIGATVATFIGRITTVAAGVNGAITVSTTAKSGTFPASSAGAHTITCKVGGAWLGPNAAVSFPFGFVTSTLTNAAGNPPRVNLKNDASYSVSSGVTHGNVGPVAFQGYTTAYEDGGRATIDAGANAIAVLTVSGALTDVYDLIVTNNGASGANNGLVGSASRVRFFRCVANAIRGFGISLTTGDEAIECEAYACNGSNTANTGGFSLNGDCTALRCVAHDNVGSTNYGFVVANGAFGVVLSDCIADTNGAAGFEIIGTQVRMEHCDAYNNGAAGALVTVASKWFTADSCNFVKNGTYGIDGSGSTGSSVLMLNCGFGSGTQANSSGQKTITASTALVEIGTVTYAADVTPWAAPATGDFRISLATAKGTGRGTFTQTQASYTGTVGYPDIGAAQHLETASGLIANRGMDGGVI